MLSFIKKHKIEIAIFSLAVAVRLALFFVCLSANNGNVITTVRGQDFYFEVSRNLLLGNGFSVANVPPFNPYFYGMPVYPYFLFLLLSLTGSYAVVSMIQLLLSSVIPLIGMRLARLITPPDQKFKNIPIVTGLLLALAPYQVLHSFIFFTETVFTVFFGIFLILFLNFLKKPTMRLIVLSGLFLGLSTLTKQTVQYVPILVIIFVLWQFRKEWKKELFVKLGCFLLIFFVVLAPWLYRNYKTFNVVGLGSGASFNIFYTLLPSVRAIDNHSTFQEEQKKLLIDTKDPMFIESSKKAVIEISHRPIALVKLCTLSAFTFFTHDGMLTVLQSTGMATNIRLERPAILLLFSSPWEFVKIVWGYLHTSLAFVLLFRLAWIGIAFCFILGLYQIFRRRLFSPQILFSVIIVFYFMLTTMVNGLSVNARFRMPVEPIIFIIACVGFITLYRGIKDLIYEHS